jgi:phosphoribosylcarboxyaminoimidazole (NCAIR) mutase
MPPGVPVATVAPGFPSATNAGVLAAQMIAIGDEKIAARLVDYKKKLAEKVEAAAKRLETG